MSKSIFTMENTCKHRLYLNLIYVRGSWSVICIFSFYWSISLARVNWNLNYDSFMTIEKNCVLTWNNGTLQHWNSVSVHNDRNKFFNNYKCSQIENQPSTFNNLMSIRSICICSIDLDMMTYILKLDQDIVVTYQQANRSNKLVNKF